VSKLKLSEVSEKFADALKLVVQANGYNTNIGDDVRANQGKVIYEEDITTDCVVVTDDTIKWEIKNTVLSRSQDFTCQFYVSPDEDETLHEKIYKAFDDIERFIRHLMASPLGQGFGTSVKVSDVSSELAVHPDNRNIALILLKINFSTLIS
jgi:hypothetical protein